MWLDEIIISIVNLDFDFNRSFHNVSKQFDEKLLSNLHIHPDLKKYMNKNFFIGVIIVLITITIFIWKRRPTPLNHQERIKILKSCRKDVSSLLINTNCYPIMLRLAWSDAGTFDKTIRDWPSCGGCNASIRFDNEIDHSSNAGLSKAIALLEPIKNKYKIVSWSDLIQMAGSLSVELLGGPKINIVYGRLDASPPPLDVFVKEDNKQKIIDSYYEIHADRLPCPQPPYPDGSPSADVHLRNIFYRMGFTNREAVALCGAHTIGRGFKDRSGVCPFSSGDQGATRFTKPTSIAKANNEGGIGMAGGSSWTENWLTFDNSYFKRNPQMEMGANKTSGLDITINEVDDNSKTTSPRTNQNELLWLPTDEALRKSPEFRSYFHQYAIDQDLFFQDYALAHKKMSELGAKFSVIFELD